jgi:hypothetical protein
MKNLVSFFSLIYYATKILLMVFLVQWWLGDAFAAENLAVSSQEASVIESQRELLNLLGDGTFSFKQKINCTKLETGSDPVRATRGSTKFYRCQDLTISFPQPDSTGANGWNGYCGQVAVSNMSSMYCQRSMSPKTIDQYATDITPGNRPGTNHRALKKIFSESSKYCPEGSWKSHSPWTANGFIEGLQDSLWRGPGKVQRKRSNGKNINISPVAILIAADATTLHWVTLVDFLQNDDDKYGCDALMNTWGTQKLMTCENLVRYGATFLFGYQYLSFEL